MATFLGDVNPPPLDPSIPVYDPGVATIPTITDTLPPPVPFPVLPPPQVSPLPGGGIAPPSQVSTLPPPTTSTGIGIPVWAVAAVVGVGLLYYWNEGRKNKRKAVEKFFGG